MNLSFAGCGFNGIYHVGVASCIRQYAPHVLVTKIAGASVGSIAAAALICDVSLGQTTTDILSVTVKARSRTLGPLSPRFDLNRLVKENLERALPENAHKLCSGRLFISVTRITDFKNVLLSEFDTREELIQALLCSCFIPLYSGMSCPMFHGVKYIDGGFSDNLPVLDENTVTVSPFAGEHDICPQDESCNILHINLANTSIAISAGNIYRFSRILYPSKPEILSKMCQQGFDDALKFLQRKNIIACTRCLGVQSSLRLASTGSESVYERRTDVELGHTYDDCADCRNKKQMALIGSLPEPVINAINEAIDQFNKGTFNWLFRRSSLYLISILGLPCTIPMDISIVIFAKVWQRLPALRDEILSKFQVIVQVVKYFLNKSDKDQKLYSAKFSCQLAITEFDYTEDRIDSSYALPVQNQQPSETCIVRTEEEKTPKRKASIMKAPDVCKRPNLSLEKRQQRKSYAGFSSSQAVPPVETGRRKSLTEVSQPQRVIRNMKFGFTVDLQSTANRKGKNKDMLEALKSLGDEDNELNVMELANKAMNMERKYLAQYQEETSSDNSDSPSQILNVAKSEALMSYYYVDDDKTFKITELYNVTDADTSLVLPDEERQLNQELQWEKDWVNVPEVGPACSISITDTLDDNEFDTSDVEYDLFEKDNIFEESKANSTLEPENHAEVFVPSKPQRKASFRIVN